jgi:hypothetical protein
MHTSVISALLRVFSINRPLLIDSSRRCGGAGWPCTDSLLLLLLYVTLAAPRPQVASACQTLYGACQQVLLPEEYQSMIHSQPRSAKR